MPGISDTAPVEDTVAKINNELAVGSDVEFQKRWMRLERIIWLVLLVFLILSFAGLFGRGPLANTTRIAADHSITVKYERIQRFGTPSVMTIELGPGAAQDGKVQIRASDSLIKPLGTQRVVPQPSNSQVEANGILYTFAAGSGTGASVEFQSQPAALGLAKLQLQIPGRSSLDLNIFVVP